MANETTNSTATNETSEGNLTAIIDTVEESGMLDALMDDPLLAAKDLGSRGCSILSEEEHEGYRLWSKRYQTLSRSKNNMILQPSYNFQLTQ